MKLDGISQGKNIGDRLENLSRTLELVSWIRPLRAVMGVLLHLGRDMRIQSAQLARAMM